MPGPGGRDQYVLSNIPQGAQEVLPYVTWGTGRFYLGDCGGPELYPRSLWTLENLPLGACGKPKPLNLGDCGHPGL